MPNSSLATVEEDGCVIRSRVQVLSPVGTREVTVLVWFGLVMLPVLQFFFWSLGPHPLLFSVFIDP